MSQSAYDPNAAVERRIDLREAARLARQGGGVGYVEQALDILALKTGPGRLEPRDYYTFGLYDHRRHDAPARRAFVGRAAMVGLAGAMADDLATRLADETCLRRHGLPTPTTEAVLADAAPADGPPHLADEAALGRFLRQRGAVPLLVQPVVEHAGAGAQTFGPWQAATDSIPLADGQREPISRLCTRLAPYRADGCLLRTGLSPHPQLVDAHGQRLSSVRMLLRRHRGRALLHRAAWRIPAATALTDGFREPTNLLAAIEPETGRVWRVVQGLNPTLREIERHPDSGAVLSGFALPDWAAAVAIARAVGELISGGPLLALDLSLTEDGPRVLSLLRGGGDPLLVQIAHGCGVLDADLAGCLAASGEANRWRQAA